MESPAARPTRSLGNSLGFWATGGFLGKALAISLRICQIADTLLGTGLPGALSDSAARAPNSLVDRMAMRPQPPCPKCGYQIPELLEDRSLEANSPSGKPVTIEIYECGCGHRFTFIDYGELPPPTSSPRSSR
jgi:hypothetical protein